MKKSEAPHGHTPMRRRLPRERAGFVHKFDISGHEGYIHVGLYPDGQPGEVFVKMSKQGSTVSGLVDGIAILTSMCLQYGVPLDVLVEKFKHTRFDPSGITSNPALSPASSVLDYLFRYLELKFLPTPDGEDVDPFDAGRPVVTDDPIVRDAVAVGSGLTAPVDPTQK